jgi:hypothetical protein
VKRFVAAIRPEILPKPFELPFETPPGHQAQVDFARFVTTFTDEPVRDDRPFAGPDPPAAVFFYSRDRGGEHPDQHLAGYAGSMHADAYAGFTKLYEANRKGGPIIEVACWACARRKFL